MTRSTADRERGSAVVEFVSLGVLLIVPLLYFVIAMGRIQAAAFAADGSAREATRAFVTATDEADGRQRAKIAVRLALRDQGFQAEDGVLALECERSPCLTPGATVVARVEVRVILPGVPRFVDHALSTSVRLRSSQTAVVDEFRVFGSEQ
jgi:hypothetical protein